MAGIFGFFDFTKPGKGVDADAPPKKPFFLFFELVWRKLSRLVTLNFMYFIICLPLIFLVYFAFNEGLGLFQIANDLMQNQPPPLTEDGTPAPMAPGIPGSLIISIFSSLPTGVVYALIVISALLFGPATCGFVYVLRNFTRQEHTWFSDFFVQMRKNWKQGLFFGLVELAIVFLFGYNLLFLKQTDLFDPSLLAVSKYITIAVALIFSFMHYYIYMMAVTFQLTARQILKNALLFAFLGVFRNILVLFLSAVMVVLLVLSTVLLNGLGELIFISVIFLSFTGFIGVFTTYPIIKKFLLDKLEESKNELEAITDGSETEDK